jgi:hypothetical protein
MRLGGNTLRGSNPRSSASDQQLRPSTPSRRTAGSMPQTASPRRLPSDTAVKSLRLTVNKRALARQLYELVTNTGWTPIFPWAAVMVPDVGALLSYAAIVTREPGIPPSSAAATWRYDCTAVTRSESTAKHQANVAPQKSQTQAADAPCRAKPYQHNWMSVRHQLPQIRGIDPRRVGDLKLLS